MVRAQNGKFDGAELLGLVWTLIREDQFDPADFVLAGSARLLATGHRERLSDIDILARGKTWKRALELAESGRGYTEHTKVSGDLVVRLCDGRIEVCDHWFMPGSDTDRLIDGADVHEGLRYFALSDIVAYKRVLDRPEDRTDLAALARSGLVPSVPLPKLASTDINLPASRQEACAALPRNAPNHGTLFRGNETDGDSDDHPFT